MILVGGPCGPWGVPLSASLYSLAEGTNLFTRRNNGPSKLSTELSKNVGSSTGGQVPCGIRSERPAAGDDGNEPSGRNPRAKQHPHLPTPGPKKNKKKRIGDQRDHIFFFVFLETWSSRRHRLVLVRIGDGTPPTEKTGTRNRGTASRFPVPAAGRPGRRRTRAPYVRSLLLVSRPVIGEERRMLEEEDKHVRESSQSHSPSMIVARVSSCSALGRSFCNV
jgi:hypothetical protein